MTEFNLSEKITEIRPIVCNVMKIEDVKEFIKRIKSVLWHNNLEKLYAEIDKLAGDKLK